MIVVLGRWKKVVVLSTILITAAGAVIAFMIEPWHESKTTVLIPEKNSLGLESLSSVGGLGAGLFGLSQSANNQRYLAILGSRRLRELLISEYRLEELYDVETVEGALKALEEDLLVDTDKKLGTISIKCRHPDPDQAAAMANFVTVTLDEINRDLSTEQATSTRLFIESRYRQSLNELKKAEDALNEFQNKQGVFSIPEQTKVAVEAAAELQAQLMQTELEYNVKRKTLARDHPDLLRLESQMQELKKSQLQMELGIPNSRVFLPFQKAPDLGLIYVRLYRDIQINSKIVEFLVPQYEQAKIQEAKDTPTLLVLDPAQPSIKPFKPKKKLITLFVCGGTLVLWLLAASIKSFSRRLKADDAAYSNVRSLLNAIGLKARS
jgi:uncharacterized protein involved in exopolysaccharide biosynthesis